MIFFKRLGQIGPEYLLGFEPIEVLNPLRPCKHILQPICRATCLYLTRIRMHFVWVIHCSGTPTVPFVASFVKPCVAEFRHVRRVMWRILNPSCVWWWLDELWYKIVWYRVVCRGVHSPQSAVGGVPYKRGAFFTRCTRFVSTRIA